MRACGASGRLRIKLASDHGIKWASALTALLVVSIAFGSSGWEDAFRASVPQSISNQLEADAALLVGWRDREGRTLLHLAAESATMARTIQDLLELEIDPNATDRFQRSALQVALLSNSHSDVILALLEDMRVDVSVSNGAATTPMQLALFNADKAVVRVVTDRVLASERTSTRDRELALNWIADQHEESAKAEAEAAADSAERDAQAARVERVEFYREKYGEVPPPRGSLSERLKFALSAPDASSLVGVIRALARAWSLDIEVDGKSIAWQAATLVNSPDVVEVLVSEGISLVLPDGDGPKGDTTVLNAAIRAGRSSDVIRAWIGSGALEASPSAASSAITLATTLFSGLDVVELLVSEARGIPGAEGAVAQGDAWLAFERLLLAVHEDPSPLFQLVAEGDVETLDRLHARGVSLTSTDDTGFSLVHQAVLSNRASTLDWLLDSGLQVDSKGRTDKTPLAVTVSSRAGAEVAAVLLERGANPYLALPRVQLSTLESLESGLAEVDPEVADLLRKAIGEVLSLHQAAMLADQERMELFLAAGHNIDDEDANGRTALMLAAASGNASVIEWLLSANANPWLIDSSGRDAQSYAEEAATTVKGVSAVRSRDLLMKRINRGTWLGIWQGTLVGPAGQFDLTVLITDELRLGSRVEVSGTVYLGQPWVARTVSGERSLEGYSGELILDSSAAEAGLRVAVKGSLYGDGVALLTGVDSRQLTSISMRLYRVDYLR